MKGLENPAYLVGYIISNTVAILLLILAWKKPATSRLLYLFLFAWASWTNGAAAIKEPEVYQDFADLAFLQLYKDFITGWFSQHAGYVVGCIAACQGLIAISLLLKRRRLQNRYNRRNYIFTLHFSTGSWFRVSYHHCHVCWFDEIIQPK